MHTKRLMALTLAAIMTISAPSGVFAAGGTTEIIQSDLTDGKKNVSVPVNVTVSSEFTVSLPSGITLEQTESGYGYSGEVGVKGDIGAGAAIRVSPDNTVTMHDVTYRPTDITTLPAQGETPEYDHKEPVSASAIQTKRLWEPADLTADTYNNTPLTMSIAELSSGKWEGQVNFDIRYIEQYVSVNATNEAGDSINAYASAITGTQKDQLLSSLVESGAVVSESDVDALIEVGSDDFEGLATTTFDVSGIATEGEKVAILHFNHNNEWELVGIETVGAENKVTGDFTDYSPVAFVKVSESGSFDVISQAVELTLGATYSFGGYNWVAAEQCDGYVVLQSTGVTSGYWPGDAMSGTLTNADGEKITLTDAGTTYTENIDGYDISNYNSTTQSLYGSIQAAEYTAATYGKGLFLVSNEKVGVTISGSQGSGHYCTALKTAAADHNSFGVYYDTSWLGAANSNYAWCISSDGYAEGGEMQYSSYVLAPAFNLETSKIVLNGNEITLK